MMEKQDKILIVDDIPQNIAVLNEILKDSYKVSVALNGEKALELANAVEQPDLILLDIMMPAMDGYDVCRQLKAKNKTSEIPVIFVTTLGEVEDETEGLALGAVDYLTKPVNSAIVKARIKSQIELKKARDYLKNQNVILDRMVKERTEELMLTQDVTIQCLASLAETRDNETGGHIRRTQNYIRVLAEELRKDEKHKEFLTDSNIDLIYKSAPLHDIGKVGIPDRILLKPGKLTDEEFEIMKKHTVFGRDAIETAEKQLGSNSFLKFAKEIAYNHHEKWDGSGYPNGIKAIHIPISARFMALVDVYDALISKRVYKPPFPHSKAVAIIQDGAGSHFDPGITAAFSNITEKFRLIGLKYADSDEEKEALAL